MCLINVIHIVNNSICNKGYSNATVVQDNLEEINRKTVVSFPTGFENKKQPFWQQPHQFM